MKSPKSEFINSNSVKQQKSPSISERFASIENSRKNTAKPEKVVHRLNYNVKISTGLKFYNLDETTAPKSSLLIQNERTAILHKLGEKVPNTVIKIDATRNYSASHRRQAIAAFREFRPEEQPEFEPLWKSKQSIQNIAFNPFYPVKPKIVQKVRANQGESKLFFQLKYGGGPQPTPVPVESTKSVQFNGVPKKNQALEKIDYDSPRPTGIWNNPIVRYFYPSSP